jgi:GxxExxY protein
MDKKRFEYLASQIFQAALEVHKALGPGLLESVYVFALVKELNLRGIFVELHVKVPLFYKGFDTGKEFYIDVLVEHEIILEIKAVEVLHSVFEAQLLSYLKLTDKKLGFLINFNVPLLKHGFKRMVNNY